MQSATPDEIDQMVSEYSNQLSSEPEAMVDADLASQMGGMGLTDTTAMDAGVRVKGLSPEQGGEFANPS